MFIFIQSLLFAPTYQKLRFRSALTLYVLVLILGSIPGARADVGRLASGLVLHSVTYAVLTFLLFGGGFGTPRQRAIKALATIMLMGALDEFIQTFLSYRRGSAMDWLVDCNAAAITSALLWAFWPKTTPALPT